MHHHQPRLRTLVVAVLCLAALAEATAAAAEKQGGRRRGSFSSLSGNPPVQIPYFRLTVFDPGLFAATCVDPTAPPGGPTGPLCRQLRGGFDHVSAGTALRHTGFGPIALRGAPPGAAVIAATLFWSVIADRTIAKEDAGQSMEISLDGHLVEGRRVAAADELCWGTGGYSVHYSADVTRLIPDAINGDYQVSDVPSSVTDGHDPLTDPEDPELPWSQGASLIVVYTHAQAAGRVYLHEGAALLIDGLDLDLDLWPPVPSRGATVLRHTRIGGDGQTHDGGPLAPFATFLANVSLGPAEVQIRGPGSPIDPSPDWQGQDGAPVPGLWDTQSDALSGPVLDPGAVTYSLRWQPVTGTVGQAAPATAILHKTQPTQPPEPQETLYDCVYVGAVAMTTTY